MYVLIRISISSPSGLETNSRHDSCTTSNHVQCMVLHLSIAICKYINNCTYTIHVYNMGLKDVI